MSRQQSRYTIENWGFLPRPGENLNKLYIEPQLGSVNINVNDVNWGILPPPCKELDKYYIEPQLGGFQDDLLKAASGVATNIAKTIEKGVKKTIDKVAQQACKTFPLGHQIAKSVKSEPGMQKVFEFAAFGSTLLVPYSIPFTGLILITDIMETCSLSGAIKTQIGAARINAKVCEFLVPIAGPIMTVVGAFFGGVPAAAGPIIAGSLQASAAMFPFYDDLYKGNYITPKGLTAGIEATIKIIPAFLTAGGVSQQTVNVLNGDVFKSFSDVFDDAKVAVKKGESRQEFMGKLIKNPPKKSKPKKSPRRSESYSPSFVDDKSIRVSANSGTHLYDKEIDDEFPLSMVLGGAVVAGLTFAVAKRKRKKRR